MVDPLLIINVVILFVMAIAMHRKIRHKPLARYFFSGLVLKMVSGVAIGLLYIVYYKEGDTILFHEDGMRLSRAFYEHPGQYFQILLYNSQANDIWGTLKLIDQPRAFFMAKAVSILHIFTNGNYWVTGFYFSFFAYSGLWTLADKLATYFPWTRFASIVSFIYFPSVVFWSSGITKEAVAIGLLAWILALYVPVIAKGKVIHKRRVLLSFFLLFLLWILKYYYAAVLIAVLTPTLILGILKSRSVGTHWKFQRQLLYWLSFFVWFVIVASLVHPNLRLDNIMDVIVSNHDLFVSISNTEDLIHFPDFGSNFMAFAKNLPRAIWAGLFQPLPWEVSGFPRNIAAVENLIVLIFSVAGLVSFWRFNVSNNGILVFIAIVYIFILAAFLAYSTPNIGTLARYKSGFLPFLIYISLADPFVKRLFKFHRRDVPGSS